MRFLGGLGVCVGGLLVATGCGQDGTPMVSATTSGHGTSTGTGGGGAGGGGAGTPLKVMTWNVRNLFDDKKNSPGKQETYQTKAQYDAHRAAVAKVVQAVDPDVVMLQEVENVGILKDLDGDLGGVYPAQALFEGNDPRGLDVGILSKVPLDKAVSHKDDDFVLLGTQTRYSYARDCLEAHITVAGRPIVLLGVHFRSKGGEVATDDPDKRLAEAQHTRAIADGLAAGDPTAGIVILGDFNDGIGSQAQAAAIGESPAFEDVAATAADPWSYTYHGEHALLDHQVANPILAGFFTQGSIVIEHGTDVSKVSDHSPVTATFAVR